MKVLKYILHVLIFMMIYVLAMFMAPSIASSRVRVYVLLGVVVAFEYVYIWFFAKDKYFSIPLSFLPIFALGALYFNHPENPDLEVGMWVLTKFLVLPYAIASLIVSVVMKLADKRRYK